MRKPGTDENNVQMSDVLCDFCSREWTEDIAMLEGHQGSCICGNCLSMGYVDLVFNENDTSPDDWECPMCLEKNADRAAQNRDGEPGWQSPIREESIACRRCIKLAAGTLHKSPDSTWTKPTPH